MMGYITYTPDKLADNPLVTVNGEHGDTLTFTRIWGMSDEMREYWQADTDIWYWVSTDIERLSGIPIPVTVLNVLQDYGSVFLKYEHVPIPDITIPHKDIRYDFAFPNFGFAIYPHYSDADGLYDKRPYLNDTDLSVDEVFEAIKGVTF